MFNVDDAKMYNDFNSLAKLKQGAREQSPEAVKEVAKQFESLFLNMVMKGMRQAKLADGLLDSQQSGFYQDMYDQQMALQLAGKNGIGLADVIAKQIGPKNQQDDEQSKLQVTDYFQRALGTSHAVAQKPGANRTSVTTAQPLDASGLDHLQRTLEQLEAAQRQREANWQTRDAAWNEIDAPVRESVSASKQAFMDKLLPHAQQAARTLGVDPQLLLAQAALETGWGQSVIKNGDGDSSFNLFNIKADKSWQGKQAKVSTLEYDGNVASKTVAGFRSYDSYKASFDDYVAFIKSNPRYGDALKRADNPTHYMRELQAAGYATDPRYAEKVLNIYRNQLTQATQADAG